MTDFQKNVILRQLTNCSMLEAKRALEMREYIIEYALEYIQRTGLAISFKGTPEEQEAKRYPKWTAYKNKG